MGTHRNIRERFDDIIASILDIIRTFGTVYETRKNQYTLPQNFFELLTKLNIQLMKTRYEMKIGYNS